MKYCLINKQRLLEEVENLDKIDNIEFRYFLKDHLTWILGFRNMKEANSFYLLLENSSAYRMYWDRYQKTLGK
jgi:hypothetical protein